MLIGVLGGGQLGRMLALAGVPLGMRFRFLDPSPEAPAGHVGELIVGSYEDRAALDRFAAGVDVVTYEFENVPADAAAYLAARGRVAPTPDALRVAQDRMNETHLFHACGLNLHTKVWPMERAGLSAAAASIGLPLVVKARRGGYDGKGQAIVRTLAELEAEWDRRSGRDVFLESFVPFTRELSLVAVRGEDGTFVAYPLVENVHRGGILRRTTAPAPNVSPALQQQAETHLRAIMERLGYVGVLAVEFFEHEGRLLANEMAPRVHNTGHWTIEGAATSQFENHCRAVAGLPLGDTRSLGPAVMVNLIGDIPDPRVVLAIPGAHLHLYGKAPRAGRKVGHVTLTGLDEAAVAQSLARVEALPGAL
ncbi:MAG: N5-carboxyaminoimidazole ribonucleotide synthase [Phycisphaerae bacterium]|nr:MAG: N5-carboxyaminoimidazole ribonucleotide synthase [Phycisphaerae bacterium]